MYCSNFSLLFFTNFAVACFHRDSSSTTPHHDHVCATKDATIAALEARLAKAEQDLEASVKKNKWMDIAFKGARAVNKNLTAVKKDLTLANNHLTMANKGLADAVHRVRVENLTKHRELKEQTANLWDSLELLMLAYIDDRWGTVRNPREDVRCFQCWQGTEEVVIIAKRFMKERAVAFLADAIETDRMSLWYKRAEQFQVVVEGRERFLCLEKGRFRSEPHVKELEVKLRINWEVSFNEHTEFPDLQDVTDWLAFMDQN